MIKFKVVFIIFYITTNFYCIGQEQKKETLLEGKWKVLNWTYESNVARGLDKEEREFLNQGFENLTMNFSTDSIFTTNKPIVFGFNNVKYELEDSKYLICGDYVGAFVLKNQKSFFIRSNVIFELEKIENYKGSKIILVKNIDSEVDLQELSVIKSIPEEDVFTLRELETVPKLKSNEDYECDSYCLKEIFNNEILQNIDYSALEYNDILYVVDFVIDKEGGFNSFSINEVHYYWDEKGLKVKRISEKNIGVPTEMKKDIIKSILKFKNKFKPGLRYNEAVNSRVNLKLRLISKYTLTKD